MSAQILFLSPKASVWLVYHRQWLGGHETTDWSFVYDYERGMTAFEAWKRAPLAGNPPFDQVNLLQLEPFPCHDTASDVTRPLSQRAEEAFARLRSYPDDWAFDMFEESP